jgi:deoxyribonuclease-4
MTQQQNKRLTFGFHTSINPSIITGIRFNEVSHYQNNSDYNISAQIFLKSPMKFCKGSKFLEKDLLDTKEYISKKNIYLVVHGQYILNFIKDGESIPFAIDSLVDDLNTLSKMIPDQHRDTSTVSDVNRQGTGVVIHMGKNVEKKSIEECIENFGKNIKTVIEKTENNKMKIILETSTKTKNGNDIFHNIETLGKLDKHLQTILSNDVYKTRIGYCIDTAHIFASGYDIKTPELFQDFMSLWDHHIGISKITVFHLNDSKVGVGCCRDLHEQLAEGCIYKENQDGLRELLLFCKSNDIPVISETGGDQDAEINLVKKLITNEKFENNIDVQETGILDGGPGTYPDPETGLFEKY